MKFFSRKKPNEADPVVDRLVRRIAEENAIDASSDAKCAAMLTEAVQAACAHVRAMVDELGEPFVLDRKRATGSALGPILFDDRKDALDALRNAPKIRKVFADPHVRECVFLLTMHRREYVIFGTEIEGEMIRRDVMQDAVEFRDHNFSAAAPSLAELRDLLTENVVLFLADLAPERLRRDETVRTEIHHSEELLKAQMKTLDYALRESRPFATPAPLRAKVSQGAREMEGLLEKLSTLSAKSDPEKCLQEIRDILLAPQHHVRLEAVEMQVGDFGVKSKTGKFIRFHECVLGDEERLAVFMASMDRDNALYLWPDLEG
ncbi:hypothetical protein DSECCO2_485060 [anaerobic digester metagenome]